MLQQWCIITSDSSQKLGEDRSAMCGQGQKFTEMGCILIMTMCVSLYSPCPQNSSLARVKLHTVGTAVWIRHLLTHGPAGLDVPLFGTIARRV